MDRRQTALQLDMTASYPEFNELDVVALLVALPAAGGMPEVPAGTVGTVQDVFTRASVAYMVEFAGLIDDLMMCVVYPEQLTAFDPTRHSLD